MQCNGQGYGWKIMDQRRLIKNPQLLIYINAKAAL